MRIVLCKGSPEKLIDVLGPFQSFRNHEIFIKLNLHILLVLVKQREKSQKYSHLSAFNWSLDNSNLCSIHGAMNFQKWELFSGSPGTLLQVNPFAYV